MLLKVKLRSKLVAWSLFVLVALVGIVVLNCGFEFLLKDDILSLEVAVDSLVECLLNCSDQWRSQD